MDLVRNQTCAVSRKSGKIPKIGILSICPEKRPENRDYCNTALPCEPGVDIILRNHSNIK